MNIQDFMKISIDTRCSLIKYYKVGVDIGKCPECNSISCTLNKKYITINGRIGKYCIICYECYICEHSIEIIKEKLT